MTVDVGEAEPFHGQPNDQNILDTFEVRVLAVLAEKEMLTPDSYPLSLNAVTNGCNQLSSRDPVMSLSEQSVLEVLQRLIQKKLVAEVRQAGARVIRYEHRMRIKWLLEHDKLTILITLMLRGAQTAGEIRMRCGRLHEFSNISAVENGLQFLRDKFPPLVTCLPRTPGTKEVRYMHLLSGEVRHESGEILAGPSLTKNLPATDRLAQLEEEVQTLRLQIDALKEQFEFFKKQFD